MNQFSNGVEGNIVKTRVVCYAEAGLLKFPKLPSILLSNMLVATRYNVLVTLGQK